MNAADPGEEATALLADGVCGSPRWASEAREAGEGEGEHTEKADRQRTWVSLCYSKAFPFHLHSHMGTLSAHSKS